MPILHSLIPEKDPLFLGGAAGNGTHPPTTTVYGRLSRPRQLPPLDVTSCIVSPKVKIIVQSLSTGKDLSLHWNFEKGILFLKAHYTGNDFCLNDPLMHATFATIEGFVSVAILAMWKPLESKLLDTDRNTLVYRLLHLFLRTQGSSLDYTTFGNLYTFLIAHYVPNTKKKWKVTLDLAMIRTDIAFTLEQPNMDISFGLKSVGEALETRGRNKEAAIIYQSIVDIYAPTIQVKEAHQAYCALAWKRAGNYMASEEAYVKALYLRSTLDQFVLTEFNTRVLISNFINMYYHWNLSKQRLGEADETEMVEGVFFGLLHKAGFEPPEDLVSHDILSQTGPSYEGMLAPQFKSKSAAAKATAFVCSASSVAMFRSHVLSCKDPTLTSVHRTELRDAIPKDLLSSDRNQARDVFRKDHFAPACCGNTGCFKHESQSTPLYPCPCKKIQYCGKSCQLAHWKEHKRTCAYLAEKKKNK